MLLGHGWLYIYRRVSIRADALDKEKVGRRLPREQRASEGARLVAGTVDVGLSMCRVRLIRASVRCLGLREELKQEKGSTNPRTGKNYKKKKEGHPCGRYKVCKRSLQMQMAKNEV